MIAATLVVCFRCQFSDETQRCVINLEGVSNSIGVTVSHRLDREHWEVPRALPEAEDVYESETKSVEFSVTSSASVRL